MSDSEEDYMSDAFLAKCQNTRPGLSSRNAAREYKQEKKTSRMNEKHKPKPRKQLEAERREEGLGKAIGEGNKGFALLQKMGFKSGMSLGKSGTGRTEPVPISVHAGRSGVGQEAERKRKQEEMTAMRQVMAEKRQKKQAVQQQDFRAERSKQMSEKQAERDLYSSQRICEQLDEQQDIEEPQESYFWTPNKLEALHNKAKSDDSDEDEEYHFTEQDDEVEEEESDVDPSDTDLPVGEQLKILTAYLRTSYLYCVWCGIRYEDKTDLSTNCPGDTFEVH